VFILKIGLFAEVAIEFDRYHYFYFSLPSLHFITQLTAFRTTLK